MRMMRTDITSNDYRQPDGPDANVESRRDEDITKLVFLFFFCFTYQNLEITISTFQII